MNRRLRRAPRRAAASRSACRQPRSTSPSGMSTPITRAAGQASAISASVGATRVALSCPSSSRTATQPVRQASTPATCTTSACQAGNVHGGVTWLWGNDLADGSFGVTSPIFLDQLTPSGRLLSTLRLPDGSRNGSGLDGDHMVTSFSSKSELALNLSTDGRYVTFMGYVTKPDAIDVSNSNTPGVIDPTNRWRVPTTACSRNWIPTAGCGSPKPMPTAATTGAPRSSMTATARASSTRLETPVTAPIRSRTESSSARARPKSSTGDHRPAPTAPRGRQSAARHGRISPDSGTDRSVWAPRARNVAQPASRSAASRRSAPLRTWPRPANPGGAQRTPWRWRWNSVDPRRRSVNWPPRLWYDRPRSQCYRHPAGSGRWSRVPGSTGQCRRDQARRRSAFMEVRDYIEDNAEGFFEALKEC